MFGILRTKQQVVQVSDKDVDEPQVVLPESSAVSLKSNGLLSHLYIALCIFLLFLTYFVAQFDKFILSYFQEDVIKSLNLTSIDYGVLSGYATSIAFGMLGAIIAQ
jgi:hypothetical protein